jgi:hypothetical protein
MLVTSSGDWALDLDSELNVVIPWLDGEPDASRHAAVATWIAGLLVNPYRPHLMDGDNVFSVQLPRSDVVVIWHLNESNHTVFVSHIGKAG